MGRYGRPTADIKLDIAEAIGGGADVLEYLRERHEREWSR